MIGSRLRSFAVLAATGLLLASCAEPPTVAANELESVPIVRGLSPVESTVGQSKEHPRWPVPDPTEKVDRFEVQTDYDTLREQMRHDPDNHWRESNTVSSSTFKLDPPPKGFKYFWVILVNGKRKVDGRDTPAPGWCEISVFRLPD